MPVPSIQVISEAEFIALTRRMVFDPVFRKEARKISRTLVGQFKKTKSANSGWRCAGRWWAGFTPLTQGRLRFSIGTGCVQIGPG